MATDILPHDRRTWMPEYAITIQVLTTLLLCIRIASRFVGKSRFGLDDFLIILAWVFGTAQTVLVLLATEKYGFDRHMWDDPVSMWPHAAEVTWWIEVTYFWSAGLVKVSVLMFYRRLAKGTYSRLFKWTVWAGSAVVIIYTITFQILLLLICKPLEASWKHWDPEYKTPYTCQSLSEQNTIGLTAASISVVTDFYAVMLPASLLMRIRISRRQKLGLIIIFGLGFLLVGVGIARTIMLSHTLQRMGDVSWHTFPVFATGIAECNLAILCASAPSLRTIFGKFFRDLSVKYSGGQSDNVGSNSPTSAGTQMSQFLRKTRSTGRFKIDVETTVEVSDKRDTPG